jgi:hypothetical protein
MNHLRAERIAPLDIENSVACLVKEGVVSAGSVSEPTHAGAAATKASRLFALDFVKGALVLVMVLYHWMNYFIGLDTDLYKYLRFLTPSFIFVTGFLVAHVYLRRFAAGEGRIPARLIQRGFKLLGIVLLLNGAARVLGTGMAANRMEGLSLGDLAWAYLIGSAPVAFSVLVPIGYLLMLSAGLLIGSRHFKALFHLVSAVLILTAFSCERTVLQNGYLEMLSIGMLGVSAGHIPIAAINSTAQRWGTILISYAAYLWVITIWNAVYAVQVVAVCVNLSVLYRLGSGVVKEQGLKRTVIRLGEYSLFAYIAQIVILQFLRTSMRGFGLGTEWVYVALLVTAGCTVLSVELLDRARRRVVAINRLYTTVFC